ncbi:UNVERIFIED_CONTAM: hypothetical protein Cloal_0581 [Acetivibrio alkalicellulosi]
MKLRLRRTLYVLTVLACLIFSGCSNEFSSGENNNNSDVKLSYLSEVKDFESPDFNKIEKSLSNRFNFILGFGVYSRNILNTFDKTFTNDLVNGLYSINFTLSDEEMKLIEKKFRDIDILSYADDFAPISINPLNNTTTYITPHNTYYLRIELDGKLKEIIWENSNLSKEESAIVLRNLIKKIEQMIYQRDEYKKMPVPKNGYN